MMLLKVAYTITIIIEKQRFIKIITSIETVNFVTESGIYYYYNNWKGKIYKINY